MPPSQDTDVASNAKSQRMDTCFDSPIDGTNGLEFFQSEFTLSNIITPYFTERLKAQCQRRGINGFYIKNSSTPHQACGVFEGPGKDIMRVKKWIETCCVPPTRTPWLVLSMSALQPVWPQKYITFQERCTVPTPNEATHTLAEVLQQL
ncbi:uncharacterized protein LOC111081071 [Drosophila obscura]|uniref:uncharacterized protein LOC111081071 n=1 Tax=Drosophila obscura TaxID=7282 RepID=UPI001BB0D7EC|nr:uncharacterized protein LOC111081071 [Drosophila obscura]